MPAPRMLRVVLILTLALSGLTAPAWASTNYRQVVDITFPTNPGVRYHDDYHDRRGGNRLHKATDLLGVAGTPIYAAKTGRIVWMPAGGHRSAGYAIQVRGRDQRLYAYYHLRRYAAGLGVGSRVKRGQVIGYLGATGNAAGTPHLHFEIHDDRVRDPSGSNRINPYRSLLAAERRGDYAKGSSRRASRSARRTSSSSVLRLGDRGTAVRSWQRQLNRTGARLATDGIFGPRTHRATRRFQRSARITVDGVVGPQSRKAMQARLARGSPKPGRTVSDGDRDHDRLLRIGDRGSAVRSWQRQLNRTGARLATDGIFGPRTHRATRRFQRSARITVDGIVGPQTRRAMARRI